LLGLDISDKVHEIIYPQRIHPVTNEPLKHLMTRSDTQSSDKIRHHEDQTRYQFSALGQNFDIKLEVRIYIFFSFKFIFCFLY